MLGKHKKSRRRGFTIVELLVVIVIIAVLASISFVAYSGIKKRATLASIESEASQLSKQLAMYNIENGDYPSEDEFFPYGDETECNDSNNFCFDGDFPTTYTCDELGNCSFEIWDGEIPPEPDPDECDGDECDLPPEGCTGPDCIGVGGIAGGTIIDLTPPSDCPTGFIPVPGSAKYVQKGFCVMKYEAKKVNDKAVSVATGLPMEINGYESAVSLADEACKSCHLMTNAEWVTLVDNILRQKSNWESGVVGQGLAYGGNRYGIGAISASSDDDDGYYNILSNNIYSLSSSKSNNQRRTLKLSNGEIIWDLSGNVEEIVTRSCDGSGAPLIRIDGDYTMPSSWSDLKIGNSIISPSPFPGSMGISGVSNESSGLQGLGSYNTDINNENDASLLDFIRGGYYNSSDSEGLLSLNLVDLAEGNHILIGFRATR